MTSQQPESQPLPKCACGRTAKKSRLPTGWKRHQDTVYCDTCWRARYLLRAISLPVASPSDLTWKQLRDALKPLWVATTQACNWMTTELYVRDVRRGPNDTKLPPMKPVYLYPETRQKFPVLPSQTAAALEHAVTGKYRSRRYEVLWTARASLPSYSYPTPFPMHNQSWHAMLVEDRPVVNVLLGDGRVDLRLKSGSQFHRQMVAYRQLARGEAVPGELAIYQAGDALMVKMVAWLPRPEAAARRSGTLYVHTTKDHLLTAVNFKDERLWNYNGDHLRRWQAEHRRKLDRWAEDAKYENLPVPSFADRRERAVTKNRHRMQSATHEIAAQLAGYAARRRFATVEYDDHERAFCAQFPWARLASLVAEKLDALGIAFVKVATSGEADTENQGPLAES
jgi:hypothetical protein